MSKLYVLDTNAVISLFANDPALDSLLSGAEIFVSKVPRARVAHVRSFLEAALPVRLIASYYGLTPAAFSRPRAVRLIASYYGLTPAAFSTPRSRLGR